MPTQIEFNVGETEIIFKTSLILLERINQRWNKCNVILKDLVSCDNELDLN